MDVEKLIEAAEKCRRSDGCNGCERLIEFADGVRCNPFGSVSVIAVRDHYEALIKSERSKVVQDVITEIESLDNPCRDIWDEEYSGALKEVIRVLEKLDSMEPDKGDTQG